WPETWIQEARRLITHEWTMRYKPVPAANAAAPVGGPAGESTTRSRTRRAAFRMSTRGKAVNPLEAYLEAPPLSTVKDPLAYWNTAIKSGSEDAALARMALDFLSISG
ncbi:hypothetical protein BD311DRAFT_614233, partial [Dichomitus squalens]